MPDPSQLSAIAFISCKFFALSKAAFNQLPHLVTTGSGKQPIVANLACLTSFLTAADLLLRLANQHFQSEI